MADSQPSVRTTEGPDSNEMLQREVQGLRMQLEYGDNEVSEWQEYISKWVHTEQYLKSELLQTQHDCQLLRIQYDALQKELREMSLKHGRLIHDWIQIDEERRQESQRANDLQIEVAELKKKLERLSWREIECDAATSTGSGRRWLWSGDGNAGWQGINWSHSTFAARDGDLPLVISRDSTQTDDSNRVECRKPESVFALPYTPWTDEDWERWKTLAQLEKEEEPARQWHKL
jgi:predicted RNase H-like nuclease (RuvC/YqgF family)